MSVRPGWPAVSGAATFQDIRRDIEGTFARSAAGVLRKGILPAHTGALITGTSTMNVAVGPFRAVLDRDGAVQVANVGTTNVLLSSAPPSGSRWSVVYVKQQEMDAPFSDTANGPVLDKVESTSSESAARALLPEGALELGVVKVDAGSATTNAAGVTITQTHPYTAMESVVLLRSQAEQDAWAPHEGALAYRTDTDQLIVYLPNAATPDWYQVGGKPSLSSITFAGIYTAGATTPRVVTQGGRVALEGLVASSPAPFNAGTTYTIGTIPADLAPAAGQSFPVTSNGVFGTLAVGNDGTITITLSVTFTGVLNLSIAGVSWRHKGI